MMYYWMRAREMEGFFYIPRRRNTGKVDLDFVHGDRNVSRADLFICVFSAFLGVQQFSRMRCKHMFMCVLRDSRQQR